MFIDFYITTWHMNLWFFYGEAKGASSIPCSEIYCGQFPESEPEVEAVAKFLRSQKDTIKLYFSIHSYSQKLLFPYSCTYEEVQNHAELVSRLTLDLLSFI